MPLEALYPTISEQIVPPMAVAEAQGVIFLFLIIDLESTVKNIELFDFEPSCHLKKAALLPTDSVTMETVKPEETADPESVQPAYQQVSSKLFCLFVCLIVYVCSG